MTTRGRHTARRGTALALILAAACATPGRAVTDERPNVLLVCVDDLRPELGAYGASHVRSPNIDRLAAEGRAFTRHYVQAPTCGASRYALLTGRYASRSRSGEGVAVGRGNDALVRRSRDMASASPSLPEVFRAAGYTTVSVGKVSHHPGGLHGADWNDPACVEMPGAWVRHVMPSGPWRHPRGAMHGLANGRARVRGETPAHEAFEGDDASYPDGWIAERALTELEELAAGEEPFFLAVGFLRPHLPFGAPARYLRAYDGVELPSIPHPARPAGRTTWHASGELLGGYDHAGRDPRSDPQYAELLRRHYLACVTYVDHLVGRLLARLSRLGLDEDTVVVLWGDHGWHLGEHGVWGKHTLFEESLRSPLIVRLPRQPAPGRASSAVVESVDLFPTLCELAGIAPPPGRSGSSLRAVLEGATDPPPPVRLVEQASAVSYHGAADTIRTPRYRLIRHMLGAQTYVELYDHADDPGETRNVAQEQPWILATLLGELERRLYGTHLRSPCAPDPPVD